MPTTHGPKGMLLGSTLVAGGVITKSRFIKRGADSKTALRATAGVAVLGVANDNQDTIGRVFPFTHRPGELVEIEAGAAFALDANLMSDADGRAVTGTATNQLAAIARDAATAAGQLVVCELVHGRTL
jgi:hypothetical protein